MMRYGRGHHRQVIAQLFDGIAASVFTVIVPFVVADIARDYFDIRNGTDANITIGDAAEVLDVGHDDDDENDNSAAERNDRRHPAFAIARYCR